MDTDAINLLVELAGRSTAEREEYYTKWQLPTAAREELESLLGDDKSADALADHVPSADLKTLFDAVRPLGSKPASATGSRHPGVIGRYEVIRLLGRGGMAEVYLARDPLLDRQIAVKLIGSDLDDNVGRKRLVQEARASGRLRHANIVTIFDAGEHEGQPYIAMEYVAGETIRSLIRRREPLPLSRRLELLEGACAGLGHAHRAGVIHLDIKPDNLMLDESGTVKVLDFGIARVLKSEVVITRHIVGTLRYMSPEQVAGGPLDHRSDVFSLASSFFELVTYSPAYEGSTQEIVTRIASGPVPRLLDVLPGVNPRLDAIVSRAMALEPADRYADLEELRLEVARLRTEIDPLEDTRFAASLPASSEDRPAAGTPASLRTPPRSTRASRSASVWRLPSFASVGALAGLAVGAAAFWMFGGPGFGARGTPPEAQIGVEAQSEIAGGNLPAPARPDTPRPEPPAPEAAPASEDVWRRLALGDREGVLQILRAPAAASGNTASTELTSNVLKAVRTSVLQGRRTASEAAGSVTLEPYRAAEERLARANQLESQGRRTEALGALWQAADLYAESVTIASRQPPPATSTQQTPPGGEVLPKTPPAPAPADESDRIARPAPAAPVEPPRPQPTIPPAPETASNAPAPAPVVVPPKAPSDADGVLDVLRRYQAAYEARDVAQLVQVFPSLGRDQVEQLQRTFAGMSTYEVQLRDPRVEVQGEVATVRGVVSRRMVPRVGGRPVTNEVETEFRLRRAGGGWVITAVTAQ